MVTVAHVVSKIIQDRPFLEEALVQDIINYAYLADMLRPEIEREMHKEVNRYAIIMALRRFADGLKKSFVGKPAPEFSQFDTTIISGVFEVTVIKDLDTVNTVPKIYGLVDFSKGDFLTITQGLYEITIISKEKYKEEILDLFEKRQIKKVICGLSSLTVRIPQEVAQDSGVLYTLTKALSWDNVNIVEMVSTLTEEMFIIAEEDTSTAFNAVRSLIKGQKGRKDAA